ncbi:hypothetical protein SDC9_211435 [bioreactor metagenome]|uniref:Uncharacterized protein n=1 Tax=bioreactor metagenome TaxID=1076179 RepID=A0A645JKN6_9ZZZZ
MHRRVQIVDVFLHSSQYIFTSQVGCGDNGESRFQLGCDILFKMAGGKLHIPKGQHHKAHSHHRSQK